MLKRSAAPRPRWRQPTGGSHETGTSRCTACKFEEERSSFSGIRHIWKAALVSAGYCAIIVCMLLLNLTWDLQQGASTVSHSQRTRTILRLRVYFTCVLQVLLILAHIAITFHAFIMAVWWQDGLDQLEDRVARVGNMCVDKAPNLYTREISMNVVVLVVCAHVFTLVLVFWQARSRVLASRNQAPRQ